MQNCYTTCFKAVKRWNKFPAVLLVFFPFTVFSQSNHTVSFSNSTTDFNALEKIAASSGGTEYYITFDQSNIFIGAFNATGFAATDNLAIYIDTDPNAIATSGNGTTTGKNYNGVTATLPFTANYNVYVEQSVQQANSYSGGWVVAAGPVYSTSVNSREVMIPFSNMGSPKALNLTMWIGNTGNIYSNAPGANITSSATPVVADYFGTFGIMNGTQGNVNPIDVISSPATGYLSASGIITTGTYANIDVTGTATITDITLAPGGIINVNTGKSLTSSGTISNTAITNNTRSTQINVSGSYTLTGRANCSYFNVNNGATYTHNSAGSANNGVAGDWPGIDSRTYGATSNVDIKQWATNSGIAVVGIPAPTSGGWGNVTFNIVQKFNSNWPLKGAFNNIAGSLTMTNIGTNNASSYFLSFNTQVPDATINIGGNFVLNLQNNNNGIILCQADNINSISTHTMNVHGDFIVSGGGHLKFGYHKTNAIINYWGNYSQTGGEIQTGANAGVKITINAKGVNKTIAATAGSFNTKDFIWIVNTGAVIGLASDLVFVGNSFSDPTNCQVIVDGTLNCYGFAIKDFLISSYSGNAIFTLSPGGTLESATAKGFTLASTDRTGGSIQTQTRDYSTQGNYIYDGALNQVTGSGLPSTVNSLTINNSSNSNTVSLTNDVTITSFHSIDKGIFSLGNKNVTLHSGSDTTCTFNQLGSGATITYGTGRYIVERYINTGTGPAQHGKTWQFLSAPANGGTVYNTWQESGSTPTGYGTWITDPAGTANGFDTYSPEPSIKTYNPVSNGWDRISSTNNFIANQTGYFLFVRGDRNATTVNATPTPTTLRVKGKLFTGNQPGVSVLPNTFQSIGNPYASAVNFQTLFSHAANIDNLFYVWDPSLAGSYGFGGYQTISAATAYLAVPGGTAIYNSSTDYSNIQSGQAIMVHSSVATAGQVNFTEDCKSTGSILVTRAQSLSSQTQLLFANLYTDAGILADGNVVAFDNSFPENTGKNDAIKLNNPGENFGIKEDSEILAIETRLPVTQADTIFYDIHNLKQRDYRLLFVPENMSQGLNAFLIDQFLKTEKIVSLGDSTFVNFSVTPDPASSVPDRFMIVFRPSEGPLAVTFVSVNAYKQNENVLVKWAVENENAMKEYEVEHSTDGIHFSMIATIAALNISKSDYGYVDVNPGNSNNYYRIRSVGNDGEISYSRVVKVLMGNFKAPISVYPNPLSGGNINLQFNDAPAGKYEVRLINSSGQIVLLKEINYAGGINTQALQFNNSNAPGIYQLEIIKRGGEKTVIKVRK